MTDEKLKSEIARIDALLKKLRNERNRRARNRRQKAKKSTGERNAALV